MSNRHYTLNLDAQKDIRSNAKLLSASTARFGGDWHSVPHAHNYARSEERRVGKECRL